MTDEQSNNYYKWRMNKDVNYMRDVLYRNPSVNISY